MPSVKPEDETDEGRGRERRFGSRTTSEQVLEGIDLTGKTVLITGSTNGIGKETAKQLAHKGAHVVMANRNMELSKKTKHEIQGHSKDIKIDLLELDLNSLESVKQCAQEFLLQGWPLHILILNAGIGTTSIKQSKDGYNTIFAVNHLGHFYLTLLLKEKLLESAPSRVVVLSSYAYRNSGIRVNSSLEQKIAGLTSPKSSMTFQEYGSSKLCNILFAFKLHRELFGKGVRVNAVHPGHMIATNIFRPVGILNTIAMLCARPFTKSLSQGAACSIYCAAHPDLDDVSGRYFQSCWDDDRYLVKGLTNDEKLQNALWEKSIEMIEKAGFTLY